MDHKGVFARKPIADIIAIEGSAFKSVPKVLGRSASPPWASAPSSAPASSCSPARRRRATPGPALVLSFVLAGIACALRRRSATPSSRRWCRSPGSAYTYAYATLGELVAWIIGWDLILEYALGVGDRRGRLVGLLRQLAARLRHRRCRRRCTAAPAARSSRRRRRATGDGHRQPAGGCSSCCSITGAPGHRHQGIGAASTPSWSSSSSCVVLVVHRASARPTSTRPTGSRSSRPTPASSASSAGAACCAAPRSSSSPTSASTRSRPRPRRRGTRSATCRSASSARWRICTVLYIAVAVVLTGHGALPPAQRRRPARRRHRRHRPHAGCRCSSRSARCSGFSTVILVLLLGQTPHLLLDEPRRAAAAGLRAGPPAASARRWISQLITGVVVAVVAAATPIGVAGRAGQHRHAARLRAGLRRRHRPATRRARRAAAVPHALGAGVPIAGHPVVPRPDGRPGADTWIRLGIWMAIGLVIYFLYGRFRSRLRAK